MMTGMRRGWPAVVFAGLTVGLLAAPCNGQEILEHPGEEYTVEASSVEVKTTAQGRITFLRGGVRITHGPAVITAQSGRVLEASDSAVLEGGVNILDGETEIVSEAGEYYRHEKKAELSGNVDIQDGRQSVQADRVVYYRDTRLAVATGSVSFKDLANNITVEGGRGKYDFSEGHGMMAESPVLTAPGEKQILMTAETMEIFRKENKAVVRGDVRVYQGEWIATCDSLVYMSKADYADMMGGPVIAERANTARSTNVRLEFENRKLRRAILSPDAEAVYQMEEGETNEVHGDEITIDFEEGKAKKVTVSGSASGTYRLKPKGEE